MRALAMVALVLSIAGVSQAATVTVVRPDGGPAPEAAVMCREHENDPLLTGNEGLADVPSDCSVVTCMAGGYVPGQANVVSGEAVCRLIEGVLLTLRLEDSRCGENCHASLVAIALDGGPVSREFDDDPETEQPEAHLGVVRPGAYTAEVGGDPAWWRCAKPIELRRTGAETILASWRPPLELRGVVIGENGAPVADVPMRVIAGGAAADPGTVGWKCKRDDWAPDVFSAEDGSFVVPIDPAIGGFVEAGSSWDPDGFASVAVAPPFPPLVTLQLKRGR